jgi:ComF family protein
MYTEGVRWRWVFSSSLLPSSRRWMNFPETAAHAAKQGFCGLFDLIFPIIFPDDCRVCGETLQNVSRIPVCPRCLNEPAPLTAEYFCAACRMPFVNHFPLGEDGRCALCRLGVSGFDAVYSYGSYEGVLRKLIHLFKYGGVQPLAKPFGALLLRALPRDASFDVIIPMPLHWRRRFERRFNQSALLAREVSKRWNVPVENLLRRRKATTPQAGLSNAKRRANVAGAFEMRGGTRLNDLRVLLIDDVLTTGASASACARVLKRAGARSVTVLTLARTDRRSAVLDRKTTDRKITEPEILSAAARSGFL